MKAEVQVQSREERRRHRRGRHRSLPITTATGRIPQAFLSPRAVGLRGGNAPLTPSLRQAWGVWVQPAGTVQTRLLLKRAWGAIVLNRVWEAPLSMLKDFLGGWARGTLLGSPATEGPPWASAALLSEALCTSGLEGLLPEGIH